MSYRWIEHTAELELSIEAPTDAAVLEEALRAIGDLLGDITRTVTAPGAAAHRAKARAAVSEKYVTRGIRPLRAAWRPQRR